MLSWHRATHSRGIIAAPAELWQEVHRRLGGKYAAALTVLATVFFMWGFATVLNDILVPHLKAVFRLNYGQSLLIQFVFSSRLPVDVPAACYVYVLFYALWGSKTSETFGEEKLTL